MNLQALNQKLGWSDGAPKGRLISELQQPKTSGRIAHNDTAYDILYAGKFLEYTTELVSDYHSGDLDLTMLLIRSGLRAAYNSSSGLFHVSMTGESGAGKNDLMAALAALIPAANLATYSSISPKALYLATRKAAVGRDGKAYNYVDSFSFLNKIIMVTEIADTKGGWSSLKAFAETDEEADFTHATSSGQMNLELTVTGPRAMWITSVSGVADDQIQRRFVHARIADQTKEEKKRKLKMVFNNTVDDQHIKNDPRRPVAQAMYGFQFRLRPTGTVEQQKPHRDILQTWEQIVEELSDAGYKTTAVKQFMTLCECGAYEKRFMRGYFRIELEDILESWYLTGAFDAGRVIDEIEVGGQTLRPKHPLLEGV
jgi:hypothetical protein